MKDLGGLGLKLSARSYSYDRASILWVAEKLWRRKATLQGQSQTVCPRVTQRLEFKSSANNVAWVYTQNYLNYEEKEQSKHHCGGLALRHPRKAQVENVGSGLLEDGSPPAEGCLWGTYPNALCASLPSAASEAMESADQGLENWVVQQWKAGDRQSIGRVSWSEDETHEDGWNTLNICC